MGRAAAKRVTTTTVETGDSNTELDLTGADNAQSQAQDEISALLGLDGLDEIQWTVTCLAPAQKAGYCTSYNGPELSLGRIQEEFGGGKYRIHGKKSDGTFAGQRTITIVERAKKEILGAEQIGAMIEKSKRDGNGNESMMLQFMAMMQAQQKSSQDILIAMLNKPAPIPPPAPDPLAMIAAMKDIFAPQKAADGGAEAAVSMLLKGVSLGEKIAGNGGDGMSGVLMQGLETAKSAFDAVRAAPQPAPTPTVVSPASQPAAVAASQPTAVAAPQGSNPAPTLEDQKSAWFGATARWLLGLASKGKAPHIYAPVFIDNIPPFISEEEVLTQFEFPASVELLVSFEPLLRPHVAWLESFRNEVLNMYGDEEPAREGAPDVAP